ncbi:hypothetical protein LOK49_Contig590G00001 [Camellia lanceoleosa]|nr:hypothetical protein LOK49_Contig590G00001 [Camellia lanceoleosa]
MTSSSASTPSSAAATQSEKPPVVSIPAAEDPAVPRDAAGGRIGGYDCRLLVYPKGDSQALPGYISIYLQIMDPRGVLRRNGTGFASYRLAVVRIPMMNRSQFIGIRGTGSSSKKKSHGGGCGARKSDGYMGKFTWRIENFIKVEGPSEEEEDYRSFASRAGDFKSIIEIAAYSLSPSLNYYVDLSVFLEVTDSRNTSSDWSCFRAIIVSSEPEVGGRSVAKESQNRCSKSCKRLGMAEFVTLTSLFDQDSGFLVQIQLYSLQKF